MSAQATDEHRILTALPNCQYNNYAPFDRPHTAPPAPSFVISWGLGERDICGKNSSHLSLNLIQIRSDRPQVQSLLRNI